jgi:hypothetical protein
LQKNDIMRYLSQMDGSESSTPDILLRSDESSSSPSNGRRLSSTLHDNDGISPREHTFVKTTFSKGKFISSYHSPVLKDYSPFSYDLQSLLARCEEECRFVRPVQSNCTLQMLQSCTPNLRSARSAVAIRTICRAGKPNKRVSQSSRCIQRSSSGSGSGTQVGSCLCFAYPEDE